LAGCFAFVGVATFRACMVQSLLPLLLQVPIRFPQIGSIALTESGNLNFRERVRHPSTMKELFTRQNDL